MIISGGQLNCTRFSVSGTVNMSGGVVTSTGIVSVNNGGVLGQTGGVFHLGNNVNSNHQRILELVLVVYLINRVALLK
ncbi:MAG: hypothetical protein IPP71_01970 [Bacteroidetes bacterium]|nr:hypothetical protein [Bacteroidota bacterium]